MHAAPEAPVMDPAPADRADRSEDTDAYALEPREGEASGGTGAVGASGPERGYALEPRED